MKLDTMMPMDASKLVKNILQCENHGFTKLGIGYEWPTCFLWPRKVCKMSWDLRKMITEILTTNE